MRSPHPFKNDHLKMTMSVRLSPATTIRASFAVGAIAALMPIGMLLVGTAVRTQELRDCDESGAIVCPERGSELKWNADPIPYIIAPRLTNLLDRRPTFAWASIPEAESYIIEMIDGITGEVLFSALAPATVDRLVYPETLPDLSPDTFYRLEVAANNGAASWQAEPNDGVAFEVLSDERAAEYAAELDARADAEGAIDPVTLAEIQQEFGLYQLAIETYRDALEDPTLTDSARADLMLRSAKLHWNELELVPEAAALYEAAYAIAPSAPVAERPGAALLPLGARDRALGYWDAAIAGYLTEGDEASANRVREERDRIRGVE